MFIYMNNIFNQKKLTIINELLNQENYLREISEKLKLPLTTIHSEITILQKNNILLAYFKKNKKYFKINYNSPLAREAIKLIIMQKLTELKNFQHLTKEKGLVKIYLYGSASNGTLDKNSDIDLGAIIEEEKYKNIIEKYRRPIEKEMGREVDLIVLTKKEFDSLSDEKRQILINIQQGTLLYGNIFE